MWPLALAGDTGQAGQLRWSKWSGHGVGQQQISCMQRKGCAFRDPVSTPGVGADAGMGGNET